ncbi:alcohol acetyltransferase [Rhexocercosporidium sp. MPI-PUGE-AT-0058]|nr:alcohol acetyltransferase [Rhexocercosporidium sp. MPI-PUGE-AT-0058]
MAQYSEAKTLRSVGNLEKFSTIPHNLGYYRCVANTAQYRTDTEPQLLGSIIERAVAQAVLKHPALCCGIKNEDGNDPTFIRVESVNLSDHIKYHLPRPSQSEDDAILEALEFQHGEFWSNLESQPPWKVIIVPTRKWPDTKGAGFDMIFAFHHALGDGLSGVVFHRSMLEALNNPSDNPSLANHVLHVPDPITLALPLEKALIFDIGWMFFLMVIWNEFKPRWLFPNPAAPWTGAVCSEDLVTNYKTNATLIQIPAEDVSKILAACKIEKATLTGLLHGLILMSLAKCISSAQAFTSATPYSLRHLTGISPTENMAVHVGSLKMKSSAKRISDIRSATNPADALAHVWEEARSFRKSMSDELAGLPNDNLIGIIPYIPDLRKMFVSMLGKPRSTTYEISNVGSLKVDSEGGKWRIQRDIFSQSGSVTGATMYFNVGSVAGGPLTITITWLDGVVDGDLVKQIRNDLEYGLKCIGQGKEIALDV